MSFFQKHGTVAALALAGALIASDGFAQHERGIIAERGNTLAGKRYKKTPIDALPFTISAPGSYVVVQDLTIDLNNGTDGIIINTDDVTINLCGYTIRGLPGSGDGILVNGNFENICIHDGIIKDWDDDGIDASQGDNLILKNLKLNQNGDDGINVDDEAVITDCIADENGGDGFQGDDNCTLTNCVADQSGENGFEFDNGTNFRGCISEDSGADGIEADQGSSFLNCTSRESGNDGFDAEEGSSFTNCNAIASVEAGFVENNNGDGLTFINCSAFNNGTDGFNVNDGGVFMGCSAYDNGDDGFEGDDATVVVNCTAARNGGDGVDVDDRSTVEGCTVSRNCENGIDADECNRIVGNTACENGYDNQLQELRNFNGIGGDGAGICTSGYGNVIEQNMVSMNDYGIEVTAMRSCIVKNRANQNGADYSIVPGNTVGQITNVINNPDANIVNDLANLRY